MSSFFAANVKRVSWLLIACVCVYVVFTFTSFSGNWWRYIATAVLANAIAIYSLSVLAAFSGIWSMGQTAFMALGAYMAANLALKGVSFEVILPLVFVSAAILGFVLGLSAGRFSILYFGLLTLAVALTCVELIERLSGLTGGDQGMAMPPIASLVASRQLGSDDAVPVCLVLVLISFTLGEACFRGEMGQRWLAVKGQRTAAMSLGLVPPLENARAFALSAGIASLAGVAAGFSVGFLEPRMFDIEVAVRLIVGAVVGGISNAGGSFFGGAFLVGVPEVSRGFKEVAQFAMGIAIMATLLFLPKGILPSIIDATYGRWSSRRHGKAPAVARSKQRDQNSISELISILLKPTPHELKIKDLSVTFGGLRALDGVSLDVPSGKTIGLIGPNGAGKTTLLNALSGYVKASDATSIRLGDTDIKPLKVFERATAGFGRSFQHAELFPELSVRETLLVAASASNRVRRFNIPPSEVTERILHGLNLLDVADKRPGELSFGVQKVVDIGRVIARRPIIVALDEPFSGLDESEIDELRDILRGMKAAKVSIIIIDHAVKEVMDIADSIVVLDFGRVLASGTAREIQENQDVQKAYFGSGADELSGAAVP